MHEYMCSQIYLYKRVLAHSFPLSLIKSNVMGFNLLRFLGSLSMVVTPIVLFIKAIDLNPNLAQKKFPEEEGPTLLKI